MEFDYGGTAWRSGGDGAAAGDEDAQREGSSRIAPQLRSSARKHLIWSVNWTYT